MLAEKTLLRVAARLQSWQLGINIMSDLSQGNVGKEVKQTAADLPQETFTVSAC